jgi:hypothetical protein
MCFIHARIVPRGYLKSCQEGKPNAGALLDAGWIWGWWVSGCLVNRIRAFCADLPYIPYFLASYSYAEAKKKNILIPKRNKKGMYLKKL